MVLKHLSACRNEIQSVGAAARVARGLCTSRRRIGWWRSGSAFGSKPPAHSCAHQLRSYAGLKAPALHLNLRPAQSPLLPYSRFCLSLVTNHESRLTAYRSILIAKPVRVARTVIAPRSATSTFLIANHSSQAEMPDLTARRTRPSQFTIRGSRVTPFYSTHLDE